MLALEQLHADALLVVLFGAVTIIASMRAAVSFYQRALVARDRKVLAALRRPSSESSL